MNSFTSRSRKILEIYSLDDKKVVFVQEMEEEPGRFEASTIILIGLWRDMGSPTTITMGIEPGDQLNIQQED